MIFNLMKLRFHLLLLIPVFLIFALCLRQNTLMGSVLNHAFEIRTILKVILILITFFLSRLLHVFLNKEIVKMLYNLS